MNTAQGFYEVYKTLPSNVQREVKQLIDGINEEKEAKRQKRIEAMEQAEKFFAPLRKGLPADYKFDREEANAR